jgi:hypothetical protein
MLRRVALVSTDVSEELSPSIIRVTTIGEPGTTLASTSNRCTPGGNEEENVKTSNRYKLCVLMLIRGQQDKYYDE